jgi:hypothetical protein
MDLCCLLLEASGEENVVKNFTLVLIKGRETLWNAGWRYV